MIDRFRGGLAALAALAALSTSVADPARAGTLDEIRTRGMLNCGVSQGLYGFSEKDAAGAWSGFDVDFCRALAAAVLKDPAKVAFVPLSAQERFDALKAKTIDVLSRNTTWTLDREAVLGLAFGAVTYYDGQGFMIRKDKAATSALELGGATVCVETGTTTQMNLADFFRANSMTYTEKAEPNAAAVLEGFKSGACEVMTRDQSALYAERLKLDDPAAAVILPDVISKEPLGPATRNDDVAWSTVVKWTAFALVNAEELGVASATLPEAKASTKPEVRRFIGAEGGLGTHLGLDDEWTVRIVEAVGNYGEMYERNIGAKSKLGIPRGLNQLWSMGGIVYAPPLR